MNQNGKQPLVDIQRLLKTHRATLIQAADTIRSEDVSNYPIFVVAKTSVEIGIPLIAQADGSENWIANASTLEEFHARRIIEAENIDDFRQVYRRHADELCVFVLDTEGGANFIFIP
jgi:hypothetical protein